MRIAAKKARYAAAFFLDLLPQGRSRRYLKCLSRLQSRLGALNDLAVADRLLEELAKGHGQVPRQASYARGYLAAASEAEVGGLGKVLKTVARRRITA